MCSQTLHRNVHRCCDLYPTCSIINFSHKSSMCHRYFTVIGVRWHWTSDVHDSGLLSLSSEHKSEVYWLCTRWCCSVTQITGRLCFSCLHINECPFAVDLGWRSAAQDAGLILWETQEWTVTSGSYVRHITGINVLVWLPDKCVFLQ